MTALFHHGWGALGSVVWLTMLGMASLKDILVVTVSKLIYDIEGRWEGSVHDRGGCFRFRYSASLA